MKVIFKPHKLISTSLLILACYLMFRILSADTLNRILLALSILLLAASLVVTYYSFFPKTIININGDSCQVNGIIQNKKINLKNICHFEKRKGYLSKLLGISQLIFYTKGKIERITILDNPLIDLRKFERIIFSLGRLS